MSRVVIVARTRMRRNHVCIGGHDLDDRFRGVRLLDRYGDYWLDDAAFAVGDLWNVDYMARNRPPPHVEDVCVMDYHFVKQVPDLKRLVQGRIRPWSGGSECLFHRTVRATAGGSPYIPVDGRVPPCSTGYWVPAHDLVRDGERLQFLPQGDGPIKHVTWVGVVAPPERIPTGSLVRVSLSRAFKAERVPEGYYVQLSGVL